MGGKGLLKELEMKWENEEFVGKEELYSKVPFTGGVRRREEGGG